MFGIVNQILEDKLRDKLLKLYDGYRKDIEVCWSYLLLVKFPFLGFKAILLKAVKLNY